jgi:hypothetical protein
MLGWIGFRDIVQDPLEGIVGREFSHPASRPRRYDGRVPRRKAHTGACFITGGRNYNNAMGDGIINSCARQNILGLLAKAHVDDQR